MKVLTAPALLLAALAALQAGSAPQPAAKPNIIFFLVDDMGWQETSVPFHTELTALNRRYRTPNMERLAAQGMKFTQAYASAVCSPTRVSALTGMNAARHRVTNWTLRKDRSPDNPSELIQPPDWNLNGICTNSGIPRTMAVTPLPALLRNAGYRTIHVGKAHFGAKDTPGEDPLNLGFDVNVAGHAAGGPGSYWGEKNFSAAWRTQPPDRIWDVPGLEAYHGRNIYLTEALTREAIKAVEQAVADRQPFYLYLAHYAVHAPWEKDDRFYQAYVDAGLTPFEATLASMLEGMDKSLGDVMAALERLGVAEETILLFMSDNGAPSQCPPNLPLRGHKLTPYEGGIREPMIVKWPGVTQPGTVCRAPVIIEDFFPTILELAGADWRGTTLQPIDGISFVPRLRGTDGGAADRAFIWHFPHHYSGQGPYSAIRQGPWKLIYHHADRRLELFHLEDDIGETRDLAPAHPDRVEELASLLSERLRAADAQMPLDKATGRTVPWLSDHRAVIATFALNADSASAPARRQSDARIPRSTLADRLEWKGVAIEEPDYTIWGASPLAAEGRFHLFAARWPEANVDPAWRKSSQIAHYVADQPEGPFRFQRVVLQGTGGQRTVNHVLKIRLQPEDGPLSSPGMSLTTRGPLRVHPDNPRYFTDGTRRPDGSLKAVYLTGAHTWNNLVDMGRSDPPEPFDFDAYLDFLQRHFHNFIRLWAWDSTAWDTRANGALGKDFIHHAAPLPWARTGPGQALDGKPKFDLTQFNPDYFERLRARVRAAGERGIYVSVMLFEGWGLFHGNRRRGTDDGWAWRNHPFNSANNINGPHVEGADNLAGRVHTLRNPEVNTLQAAYLRKVVDTLNDLDNVLYEVINEGGEKEWNWWVIQTIHEHQRTKPNQHPVGNTGHGAERLATMLASPAEWISPGRADGFTEDPPAWNESKVSLLDTDHVWGVGGNSAWVWKSFLRGHNPIFMDPYDGSVLGQDRGWEPIRAAMGHTRRLAERVNLASMRPRDELASTGYCLAEPGMEYVVYQPKAGERFTIQLIAGTYQFEWFDPAQAKADGAGRLETPDGQREFKPPFDGDAVLHLKAVIESVSK